MWDFGKDFDAKKHCDENAAKLSLAVAFMANARLLKVQSNKACTRIIVRMRLGKRIVRVEVGADESAPFEAESALLSKILSRFGVPQPWNSWTYKSKCASDIQKELERRGATCFEKVNDAVDRFCMSAAFKKKRADHKAQSELNRARTALKNARAAGATPRQMRKLISQIMAEEAVAEVQAS